MNRNEIAKAASTETLANLLIDIDAYAASTAMYVNSPGTFSTAGYEAYKNICDRIELLSDRLGVTFGDVLHDKGRIEDELHRAAAPDCQNECCK